MKHIVGVADAKISDDPQSVLITHALGSCLGIAAHDPMAKVGGLLHVMMPLSTINRQRAKKNPFVFVDTALPLFFKELYACGAVKKRLTIRVTGGASIGNNGQDRFNIGKRNYIILKRMFWRHGVLIEAEDVGGTIPRTMSLEIGTGRVWLSTAGQKRLL